MLLLTGANGFIGSQFLSTYKGNVVKVLRTKTTGSHSTLSDTFYIDSLNSRTNWGGVLNKIDCVVHLAAVAHGKGDDFYEVNYEGTIKLAKEAAEAGVKRFIFLSSVGVLGNKSDEILTPCAKTNPQNRYTMSKYLAEEKLLEVSRESDLEVIIIRPTLVYGAHAPGNFKSLANLVRKSPLLPFGCANNKRDFISVHNLVDLICHCIDCKEVSEKIFIASESETVSTKEFTNEIALGLGKTVIQLPIPVFLVKLVATLLGKRSVFEQVFGNLYVDSSNLSERLGWTPPFTMRQSMSFLNDSHEK